MKNVKFNTRRRLLHQALELYKQRATEVVAYNMEFIEKREAQPTSAQYAPQEPQNKGLASLGKEVPFSTEVPF